MQVKPISEFQQTLNFFPAQSWPANMPCYGFDGELLCGFGRSSGEAVELTGDLASLFIQIYPVLKLSELARLSQKLQGRLTSEQMQIFLSHYGYRSAQRTWKFFSNLCASPESFQQWCDEKQPGPNDLNILMSFENLSDLKPVFDKITRDNMSKSNGCKALELAGELILMRQLEFVKASLNEESALWLKSLKRKRFPLSARRIETAASRLSQIPWPKNTSAQLKPSGDRDLLELNIRATSLKDLSERLDQLKKISDRYQGDDL